MYTRMRCFPPGVAEILPVPHARSISIIERALCLAACGKRRVWDVFFPLFCHLPV
jgi:hypothetical protein